MNILKIKNHIANIPTKIYYLITAVLLTTIGFVIRVYMNRSFTGFMADQAYHGEFINRISRGEFVSLGSLTSASKYLLLPYHYYLNSLMSGFNSHPYTHTFMNLILCSLSILLIYVFVVNITSSKYKELIGFLVSFMFVFSYHDIRQSGFEWNPNTQNFFTILFILVIYKLIISTDHKAKLLYSSFTSFCFVALLSLHSSSLYTSSVFISLIMLFLVYKKRIYEVYCLIGSAFLLLIPYLIGEYERNFTNTKEIIKFVVLNKSSTSILVRIEKTIQTLLDTFRDHLTQPNFSGIGTAMVFIMIILLVQNYKSINLLFFLYLSYLVLFFGIISSYPGPVLLHFRSLSLSLFFFVLAFLLDNCANSITKNGFVKNQNAILLFTLLVIISSYFSTNLILLKRLDVIYNSNSRIINYQDNIDILSNQENSHFCFPEKIASHDYYHYEFINKYIVKNNNTFSLKCKTGDYVIVSQNDYQAGVYNLNEKKPNQLIDPLKGSLITETNSYKLYRVTSI
jgi:uncharacterized membrane protein